MVTFVCSNCNSSLKKSQVQAHGCNGKLACVTCNVDFNKSTYKTHDRCISEAQKYQGSDYKAKVNKGEIRQENWTNTVIDALNKYTTTNDKLRSVISQLKTKSNFPNKEAKFKNFMNNVNGVRTVQNCSEIIWKVIADYRDDLKLRAIVNGGDSANISGEAKDKNDKRKPDDSSVIEPETKKFKLEDKIVLKTNELSEETVSIQESKKHKKKKTLKNIEEKVEESQVIDTPLEDGEKKKKKKKKSKTSNSEIKDENVNEIVEEVEICVTKKDKKKKDKKLANIEKREETRDNTTVEAMEVEESTIAEALVESGEKKKKKKKKVNHEDKVSDIIVEQVISDTKKTGKNKKKSKKEAVEA